MSHGNRFVYNIPERAVIRCSVREWKLVQVYNGCRRLGISWAFESLIFLQFITRIQNFKLCLYFLLNISWLLSSTVSLDNVIRITKIILIVGVFSTSHPRLTVFIRHSDFFLSSFQVSARVQTFAVIIDYQDVFEGELKYLEVHIPNNHSWRWGNFCMSGVVFSRLSPDERHVQGKDWSFQETSEEKRGISFHERAS